MAIQRNWFSMLFSFSFFFFSYFSHVAKIYTLLIIMNNNNYSIKSNTILLWHIFVIVCEFFVSSVFTRSDNQHTNANHKCNQLDNRYCTSMCLFIRECVLYAGFLCLIYFLLINRALDRRCDGCLCMCACHFFFDQQKHHAHVEQRVFF